MFKVKNKLSSSYMFLPPASNKNQTLSAQETSSAKKHTYSIIGLSAGLAGLAVLSAFQYRKIQNLKNVVPAGSNPLTETIIPYEIQKIKNNELYKTFQKSKSTYMDFINGIKEKPLVVKEFLFSITADNKASAEFIEEIVSNPRKNAETLHLIQTKIGGEKNLLDWLQAPKGYNEAYERFANGLVNNPDKSIDELIKISPNWHLFTFSKLDQDFTFGRLPDNFQKLGDYSNFVNWLEKMTGEFYDKKTPLIKEYSGQFMKIELLKEGASYKIPYKIQFIENNVRNNPISEPYVLKIQRNITNDNNPFVKENTLYRSDSSFLNAQLDYYMNLNNCENAPKFHYFDYRSSSALYGFTEGSHPAEINNLAEANKNLRDMNLLGIHYNDVCAPNFIVKNGKYTVIDIGDSSFIDPLRPGVKGLQFELPNWAGPNFPNLTFPRTLVKK